MYLDQAQLAVADHVAEEGGRYAINAVAVEPDGTCVATDGRQLMIVEPSEPRPEPNCPVESVPLSEQTLFPAHVFADTRSTLCDPDRLAAITAVGDYVELTTRGRGHTYKTGGSIPADLKFPDWRSLQGDKDGDREGEVTVHVNPRMLAKSLLTLASMLGPIPTVEIRVAGLEKTLIATACIGLDRKATAVVSPVKVHKPRNLNVTQAPSQEG